MGPLWASAHGWHRSFRSLSRLSVCTGLAILVLLPGTASGLSRAERVDRAVGFMASQQAPNGSFPAFSSVGSTADAVLALVASGDGRKNLQKALRFLERRVSRGDVVGVGLQAKVVLAAVAAGEDPRDFGGRDLVTAIVSTELPDGRLGDGTAVFDQALGVLAIVAARRTPSDASLAWLAAAQCDDGGWQFDAPAGPNDDEHCLDQVAPASDFFLSDTNTTALAVQALAAAGGSVDPASDPIAFFDDIRDDERGGWGYSWGVETTDANSTALVIQAYAAANEPRPKRSLEALRALQYPRCGAFAFTWVTDGGEEVRSGADLGATIGGVLGLLGEPLPIVPGDVTGPAAEVRGCAA
jgi:hypothetical protein